MDQTRLKESVHVVVDTPGRVFDVIQRRILDARNIRIVVLDEADEMLSRAFKYQIYEVFRLLPSAVQVILVSTMHMPADVLEMTKRYMHDPLRVVVKEDERTLESIKQLKVTIEREDWKLDVLFDLYEGWPAVINAAIIFCNTRRKVDWLQEKMTARDFTVCCMHDDLDQAGRDLIMREFRSGSSRVLITTGTDILARGIHVQQVSFVINYDLPVNRENYIRRIGYSYLFGRKGVAINFVTPENSRMIKDLEQFYNIQIEEMDLALID